MIEELASASHRLSGELAPHIRHTPLEQLSAPGGADPMWAKCENLQVTGSFKVRGAIAALLGLGEAARRQGVVTASTGNHGAAVAYGGHRLGVPVRVYVPADADPSKTSAIERWGATLEPVAGDPLNAELAARAASDDRSVPYISPYNDPAVVAGQGTIGVELLDQLDRIDTLVVAVGGGGLIGGTGSVIRQASPETRIVGASPTNSNVMMQSVAAGEILDAPSLPTLSDGTAGGVEEDSITFALCRDLVDEWVSVDEAAIAAEMRRYIGTHHQLVEGSAAVALAAAQQISPAGTTAVVLCGANVAPATLRGVLSGEP